MAKYFKPKPPNAPALWHNENGFKYALFPAKMEKPQQLVIYLHGFGSNAEINENFVQSMHDKLPGADIISLQAPIRMTLLAFLNDNPDRGYSWLHFGQSVRSHLFNRLSIARKVEKFARAELKKRGLTEDNLAYFGTSMGGMVVLQAALSGNNKPPAAVVSRSGAVLPFTKVRSKTDVFLQIGEEDKLFYGSPAPKGFLERIFSSVAGKFSLRHGRSVERLKKQGVSLTQKIYAKQGHTLNLEAWNDSMEFIAKAFAARP